MSNELKLRAAPYVKKCQIQHQEWRPQWCQASEKGAHYGTTLLASIGRSAYRLRFWWAGSFVAATPQHK